MELNKGIVRFVLKDWMGNLINEYDTLDEAEEAIQGVMDNDGELQALKKSEVFSEDEVEEFEDGIREDLYIYGYDDEGNEREVEFG